MSETDRPVGVVVVGCGAWGRNLVRTFHTLPGSRLVAVCDTDEERLAQIGRQFAGVATTTDLASCLADPSVEAVVVGASAAAHESLALAAIAAGKHVYVEKPLALSVEGAERVVQAADEADRVLMVGHLLLYHACVLYLKDLIDRGDLGDLYYLYSQRVNLGVVRQDENALWSFGPHDVSIMNFLMDAQPDSVTANGHAYLQEGVEDVVFVNLRYPGGRMGQIQLSWLDPHKIRKLTLVGSRKMAVFDDMSPGEKVRIYDKGAEISREYATYGEYLGLRHGDVVIPRVKLSEPLAAEGRHFLDCVRTGERPRSDGRSGLDVVRVLAAASRSLAADGAPMAV